jgi:hypothetical protein
VSVSKPASEAFVFVAGGTVQAGGGVYLERDADRDVLEHCRAGDFTYILTSRQMGKSSMMIRTAERLAKEGTRPVIIDLTELGTQTTSEQWYKGFLFAVQDQLGLGIDASAWWNAQPDHSFAHRFTRYLREVALVERRERIVVFVDEIDTTLRLDFTDDFFAAIRFLYQNRAADPNLARLSFVLIGVATPGDLIKDGARTPFNVGQRVELTDFTVDEAEPLIAFLGVPPPLERDLITWILLWTGGHPYLTLRVVRSLAEDPPANWTRADVDARISELFFGPKGESDSNLQFVRDMLTKKAFDREAVLRTYRDIRGGVVVIDNELDQVRSWLKLSGVVGREAGTLRVRNAVYRKVFDEAWARHHLSLNLNWRRRLTRVASVLLVLTALITIPLAWYAWQQKGDAEAQRDQANRLRLAAENSLNHRLAALANAQRALDELKRYNPESAAAISAQVTTARAEATKELEASTAGLRSERDSAMRRLRAAEQQSSMLRDENARLADQLARVQADIVMPRLAGMNLNAASKSLARLQLSIGRTTHQNSATSSGTVLGQWPLEGAKVPRGAVVDLLVSDGNRNIELPADLVRASTDESGRFTKKVTPGSYDVWFQASGFEPVVYQGVQVSPSSGARLDVGLRPSQRGETTRVLKGFAPGRASMIEGTVLDQGGKAMPRVAVTMVKK